MARGSPSEPGGRRELGLWPATALVIGHTIAVGIFLTPAELIGALASPPLTLALWLVGGGLVLAGAFTFGELASRYPFAGGPYLYLREAYGERAAFLYGWQSMLVMDPGVTAALATGLSGYLVVLWPPAAGAERWIAVAVIWALAGVSMAGVRLSARVLGVITAGKLIAFAAVIAAAFAADTGTWANFRPGPGREGSTVPSGEAFALGLVSIFFSFGGFWEASRMAGEVRRAPQTMPAALAIGVACVTAVYLATSAAFIYVVPVEQATDASAFARRAGEAMFGPAGPQVLAFIVVLSVLASALALLIMAPRLYLAMSRDGMFPPALAAVHPVAGTPVRATLVLAAMATLFALLGTFQQIVTFFMCTALAFIALAASALIVIRRRSAPAAAFRAPAYPVSVVLFVLFVAAVVVLAAVNQPWQALAGLAIVLLGLPGYRMCARPRTPESTPPHAGSPPGNPVHAAEDRRRAWR